MTAAFGGLACLKHRPYVRHRSRYEPPVARDQVTPRCDAGVACYVVLRNRSILSCPSGELISLSFDSFLRQATDGSTFCFFPGGVAAPSVRKRCCRWTP